jgi:putative phosphoesterase
MRVAALYDIHGNVSALDAVLEEAEAAGVDAIVVGGDLGTGPLVPEALERLRGLGDKVAFIHGNADRELVAAFDRTDEETPAGAEIWRQIADWNARQLTREQRDFLARLPERLVLEIDGLGATLFCHGSPRSDVELITPATPDDRLSEMLAGVAERVVVCGHTHMQFDRTVDSTRVINAGSVGMPYEGAPGAYWALLGPDLVLRRTAYDFEDAAARIRAVGCPDAEQHISDLFIAQPTREQACEAFEKMATGS